MIREVQISADFINDKIVNKKIAVEHDPNLFTPHARDPKIFKYEDNIYMIFGVQCQDDKLGGLALYKTTNYETFTFDRILKPSLKNQNYGYM
jgi:beta-fructofuranosidase